MTAPIEPHLLDRRLRRLAAFASSSAARRVLSPVLSPAMASPPTVTTQTSVTSTITSAQTITVITEGNLATGWSLNPKFTRFGWPLKLRSTAQTYAQPDLRFYGGGTGLYTLAFGTDADVVEFYVLGQSGNVYKLKVNGQPVTATSATGPTSGGLIVVSLGSAGTFKHIEFVGAPSAPIYAVRIGPTFSITPSSSPIGDQLLILGDSYAEGANGPSAPDTWAPKLAELLGFRDVWTDAIGGTGVAATGGGIGGGSLNKSSYRARIENDYVLGANPAMVVIQGSVNDSNGSTSYHAQLPTEYPACVALIRRYWPDALLVGTDVMRPSVNLTGADQAINSWLLRNAKPLLDVYTNSRDWRDPWFTGAGSISAPSGAGNSDRFMSSDGIHPTEAGDTYIAYRIAAAINAQALEAESRLSVLA